MRTDWISGRLLVAVAALGLFPGLGAAPGISGELDIQGHRGARGLMPENSLPAFERALQLGVTTLELDLQVTQDGVLAVYHDQRINPKLCVHDDGSKVKKAAFKELRFEELADVDCGRKGSSRFPEQQRVEGTRIPRLEQVFDLAVEAGYPVRLNIEIKMQKAGEGVPVEEFAGLLIALIKRYGLHERTTVQSFDVAALQAVRKLDPDLPRSILVRDASAYDRVVEQTGASVLSPRHDGLEESDVKRFQERGVRVIPWTVNDPAAIRRMIEWGVDGIISDYPDRVLEIRAERTSGS